MMMTEQQTPTGYLSFDVVNIVVVIIATNTTIATIAVGLLFVSNVVS